MLRIKILIIGSLMILFIACSDDKPSYNQVPLFTQIASSQSSILFNNQIPDDDSLNILNYEYIYNGGGVALADFNNDGLCDIFFTGNIVPNSLYQNLGNFQFEDISEASKITAHNSWSSGVSIVDINQDGLKDIYVCTNTKKDGKQRQNLLFINKTKNPNKIKFEEIANSYGIADSSYSTQSAFFDFDNDGDLDLFIANNHLNKKRHAIVYSNRADDLIKDRVDKLYRNDWSDELGHPFFTDISKEAGIKYEGYSLGLNICDINQDGWKDIYVTNDFNSNDLLYVNNQNGTFTNKAFDFLKHTSHSAMGNDIADVNNDGRPDIVTVDMLPETNYRKKTMLGPTSYATYRYNEKFGYMQQYVRNTLQVNHGFTSTTENDVIFGDVAMLAGVEATDWSWAPLLADFDLDGDRDLIITNGFPKDITDRDFMSYQSNYLAYVENEKMLAKIPEVKIPNYAYRNTGNLKFENVTDSWGLNIPSFSNGAAYGDLDNDGDLDLVINNINDEALLYKNESSGNNSISINLIGNTTNKNAIGTIVKYQSSTVSGIYEHSLSRGYLSSMDDKIIIGLGQDTLVELIVNWPDGRYSELTGVRTNQTIDIEQSEADQKESITKRVNNKTLFTKSDITPTNPILEEDHIDYNVEPLLLHKLSQYGPGLAVGDVNGDGLDDFYITGSYMKSGKIYLQTPKGGFKLDHHDLPTSNISEEQSALFFDIDGDGDQDLYVANGSNQFEKTNKFYKDALLINENGIFTNVSGQFDLPNGSSSCVRASDYDRDGDLDLFVGGRVNPGEYPMPVNSYLLINNSVPGKIDLKIANKENAPELDNIGMVCDALWTDFDSDGWQDLIIAGEWMPVTIFKNNNGTLEKSTAESGLSDDIGWWNSITASDFDHDGDIDYVVSNYGGNSSVRTSPEHPVKIFAADFDENGAIDALPFVHFKNLNGDLQQFSFHGRGDLALELNRTNKRFTSHQKLAIAPIDSILSTEEIKNAYQLKATTFATSYINNKGDGSFEIKAMPYHAQLSPIYGMVSNDFNQDGNDDILMVGNDFGAHPSLGRMDAMNGLLLNGHGDGTFSPISIEESGIFANEDCKALVELIVQGKRSLIISQNNGPLLNYKQSGSNNFFNPESDDYQITYMSQNGSKSYKKELYYGNGFLSQSSRKILIPENVTKLNVTKYNGDQRSVDVN